MGWVVMLLLSCLTWFDCVEMDSCDVCVCMNWDRNRIVVVVVIVVDDVVVDDVVVDDVVCCGCCRYGGCDVGGIET